jgi:hypothetical protein
MKEKKSATELEAMIMQEIPKHADWSFIQNAVVTPHNRTHPHHANWSVAFVRGGQRAVPQEAEQFATELAAKFDLA